MAEQRKSWHGQSWDFGAVADEQIAAWPRSALFRWVPQPAQDQYKSTTPAIKLPFPPGEKAAGYVRPELRGLLDQHVEIEEQAKDAVHTAFVAFLEGAQWVCHRCGARVDNKTLKVPPPLVGADGAAEFRMFCSSTCAEAS